LPAAEALRERSAAADLEAARAGLEAAVQALDKLCRTLRDDHVAREAGRIAHVDACKLRDRVERLGKFLT
jgi:hypothetical protein